MSRKKIDPFIRFTNKWKLSTEHFYNGEPCWEWTPKLDFSGYGRIWVDVKYIKAHRWSYEHYRESIADGLQIDHLCRIRHCVNPAHLETVTSQENTRRGLLMTVSRRLQKDKTHCRHGHTYDEENTFVNNKGWRECRTCQRARANRTKARRKAGTIGTPRTHCKKGHLLSKENTYLHARKTGNSYKTCRTCNRETDRRRYYRTVARKLAAGN